MTRREAFYGKTQTIMIMPGTVGAHNWAPMSFNPHTGIMYIPSFADSSSQYAVERNFVYTPGNGSNKGITGIGVGQAPPPPPTAPPGPALPVIGPRFTGGWLVAWDVVKQKEVWRVPGGGSIFGGTVTTAGNLVFLSLGNGRLRALTADKGEVLMEIPTGQSGGMGPPITYMLDNKQYVAVAGGQGLNQGGRWRCHHTSGDSSRLRLRPRRQSAKADDGDRSELEGELLHSWGCC